MIARSLRAAWACRVLFIDVNDGRWMNPPGVDDAVEAMLSVAAREADEAWLAGWLRERVSRDVSSRVPRIRGWPQAVASGSI